MIPKKIYINKKTADSIGEYSSVTASVRTSPNSYHDEVEYTDLKSVWHDASVAPKPINGGSFVLARFSSYKLRAMLLCVYPKTDWGKLRKHWYGNMIEWAYVDDLLPKERKNEKVQEK